MDVSSLRSMVEMLTLAPEQRIHRRLAEIEAKANARLEAAATPVPEPDKLRQARADLEAAKQASVDGFWNHTAAQKAVTKLKSEEPSGLMAMISLANFRWRKALEAAEAAVTTAQTAWNDASDAKDDAQKVVDRLAKEWDRSAERRIAEQAQRDQKSEAVLDKALVREARAILSERPELARGGLADVIERARERLQEQERQEAARRHRDVVPDDRPSGPKFR